MPMFRQISVRVLTLVLASAALASMPAHGQDKLDVYVLKYASPTGANVQPFLALTIQDRLRLLAAQIANGRTDTAYLQKLKVQTRPDEMQGDLASLRQRWQSRNALLMMWGTVITGSSGSQIATSSIYLGALAPPPLDVVDAAKIDLKASNHTLIKDSHSYVAAYALLLDARRNNRPRATIGAILAALHNIYARVHATAHRAPELDTIKSSVDAIARQSGFPA